MSALLKSKTLWFSYLTAAAGIIQQVAPFVPEKYSGVAFIVLGAVTAALRSVTVEPLSAK